MEISINVKNGDNDRLMTVTCTEEKLNSVLDYIETLHDVTYETNTRAIRYVVGGTNPIPYLRFWSCLPDDYKHEIIYLLNRFVNDNRYDENLTDFAKRLDRTKYLDLIKPFYFNQDWL